MLYYVIYVYVCMNTHSICMSIITFPPVHLHIPSFSCGSPVLTACCGFSSESSSKSFLRTKKVMREQARQNINMNISWNERANISDIYFDTDLIRSETSGSTWIKSNQISVILSLSIILALRGKNLCGWKRGVILMRGAFHHWLHSSQPLSFLLMSDQASSSKRAEITRVGDGKVVTVMILQEWSCDVMMS